MPASANVRRFLWLRRAAWAAGVLIVLVVALPDRPERTAPEHIGDGDALLAAGRAAEAVSAYRLALQLDASQATTRRRLAEAYLAAGDRASAAAQFVRASDMAPADPDLQVRAGGFLLAVGQFDDAVARADRALAVDTRHVPALILRANARARLRELESMLAELETAAAADPTSGVPMLRARSTGVLWGAALAAEGLFQEAVAIAPTSAAAHLALANFYLAAGRGAEAGREFETAVSHGATDTVALRGLAYFNAGRGDLAGAEPPLRAAALHGTGPDGKLALSAYYASQGRLKDARRTLEDLAAAGAAGSDRARLQLAGLALAEGNRALATELVDRVLADTPLNTRALAVQTELLVTAGRKDDALAAARKAVDADRRSALAHYTLGKVRAARDEDAEAVASFNEALRIDPALRAAKADLAAALLAAGKLADAENRARNALADAPDSDELRLLLAHAQFLQGNLADAEPAIRRLAAQQALSPAVQSLLGLLELRRGNETAARAAFARALVTAPAHVDALVALVDLDLAGGRAREAHDRVLAVMSVRGTDPDLALAASRTFAAVGDWVRAEALAQEVVTRYPDRVDGYLALGLIYRDSGRLAAATTRYRALVAERPTAVVARTVLGYLFDVQGRSDDAREAYRAALQRAPGAIVPAALLARQLSTDGSNLGEALALAEAARQLAPNQPEVADTVGWIYHQRNLHISAIAALEEAVARRPRQAEYRAHLQQAQAATGRGLPAGRSSQTAALSNRAGDARPVPPTP